MDLNGIHLTVGGLVAIGGAVLGFVRLIAAIRPWFDWRRRVNVRLAALENPDDVNSMRDQLL